MEKAGMRLYGRRVGIEDGESVDLVVYEAVAGITDLDTADGDDSLPGGGAPLPHCSAWAATTSRSISMSLRS